MKGNRNSSAINRRRFVGNTIKLVALGSMLGSLGQSCNNKKEPNTGTSGPDTTKGTISKNSSKKHPRKKWNYEALVLNKKTNIIHFPTAKVYTYYDEIKTNHLHAISLTNMEQQFQKLQDINTRFNKDESGIIYEILALQHLRGEINQDAIYNAYTTLAGAFTSIYAKANEKNFRLHELFLQLITLHAGIPPHERWEAFDLQAKRPASLRKRQAWMANETNFTQRVDYVLEHKNEYIARLNKRALRYSFT